MRYLVLVLILLSCESRTNDVKLFEDYLGTEESESLKLAITAWDDFVNDNRRTNSVNEFTLIFLQGLLEHDDSLSTKWTASCDQFKNVIQEIKKSGLEKEFWMYSNETYDDPDVIQYYASVAQESNLNMSIDTTESSTDFEEILTIPEPEQGNTEEPQPQIRKVSSSHSSIIAGIHKYCKNTLIKEGAEVTIQLGSFSSSLIAKGIIENKSKIDFSDYFTKVFIIQTIFYDYMYGYTLNKC